MSRADLPPHRAATAQLLSLASHELRTPVSVVSGYLRMLQRDAPPSESQRKMIDEAAKACSKLAAIISELSDIAKLDDGRIALQSAGLDLFMLVREIASNIDEAKDREVSLELHGCEARGSMRGDLNYLRAALTSLIRAVMREQPDRTVVRLQCVMNGDGVQIAIGRADVLDAARRQPEAPFDDQRGGLGLALPIARRVIEAHHGRIWSPADAAGSTASRSAVFLVLPTD